MIKCWLAKKKEKEKIKEKGLEPDNDQGLFLSKNAKRYFMQFKRIRDQISWSTEWEVFERKLKQCFAKL